MFVSISVVRRIFQITHRHRDDSCNTLFRSGRKLFSSLASEGFPIRPFRKTNIGEYPADKVEEIIILLKNYGFEESHISSIARAQPRVLLYDAKKTLIPKIDFLQSIGVPITDIPKVIARNPSLLGASLEKQIQPCYDLLVNLPLSKEEVIMMVSRNPRILGTNVTKIANNIEALQQSGVPSWILSYFVSRFPSSVQRSNAKFSKCLAEVTRLGFNPLRLHFVMALRVLCELPKRTLDYKVEVLKRFGLSDDEITSAFRLRPDCMNASEEKVLRVMDFFKNKMKWEAAVVTRSPAVLLYNLEKRTAPRCKVIDLLMQKGFLKDNYSLMSFLKHSEENFLNRFVYNYKDELPQLLDVYRQNSKGDASCTTESSPSFYHFSTRFLEEKLLVNKCFEDESRNY